MLALETQVLETGSKQHYSKQLRLLSGIAWGCCTAAWPCIQILGSPRSSTEPPAPSPACSDAARPGGHAGARGCPIHLQPIAQHPSGREARKLILPGSSAPRWEQQVAKNHSQLQQSQGLAALAETLPTVATSAAVCGEVTALVPSEAEMQEMPPLVPASKPAENHGEAKPAAV